MIQTKSEINAKIEVNGEMLYGTFDDIETLLSKVHTTGIWDSLTIEKGDKVYHVVVKPTNKKYIIREGDRYRLADNLAGTDFNSDLKIESVKAGHVYIVFNNFANMENVTIYRTDNELYRDMMFGLAPLI